MSDNNPVEPVVEVVEGVIEPPAAVVEEETEPRPEWVDEIIETIKEAVTATDDGTPNPVEPENPELPADGEVIPDESPVSKPWTHKRLFGKG